MDIESESMGSCLNGLDDVLQLPTENEQCELASAFCNLFSPVPYSVRMMIVPIHTLSVSGL
jgi:hypothetical protein